MQAKRKELEQELHHFPFSDPKPHRTDAVPQHNLLLYVRAWF
jgi:hypothetical protein